jgi:D-glycero-D-manno-heptose 1,7-bisphosphate phosphatase
LLHEFSQDHKIDLAGIFCIGDSFRDLQAAWAVDANPLLVKTGKGQRTLEENPNLDVPVFADLYAASQFIISQP